MLNYISAVSMARTLTSKAPNRPETGFSDLAGSMALMAGAIVIFGVPAFILLLVILLPLDPFLPKLDINVVGPPAALIAIGVGLGIGIFGDKKGQTNADGSVNGEIRESVEYAKKHPKRL